MRSENKTRFLPAVEPSTAGFISDSVPTDERSSVGFYFGLCAGPPTLVDGLKLAVIHQMN